ncbi:MAG: thiol reductant ABC exporter subunit CydD, partial [Eggerthellaceae bacterium]|nr:thiol reductant ABC exporter subunit CydD [Eggerthellaceae bacterium]
AISDVYGYLVGFFACFALLQLVRFAQESMLEHISIKRAEELRAALLKRVFDPKALLARHEGAAHVTNLATDGIEEIQTYIRIFPPKMIAMAAISFPILACLFALDWVSAVICAVMFPVIMFFMVLLGKQARARSERQYVSYTRLTNRFMDTLRGMRVINAFKAGDDEAKSVWQHSEGLRKATVDTLKTATLSSVVLDLCATFGVAAVAMMLAFRLLDGSLALSTGLFALILAPEFFSPIRSFASDYHASLNGKNSLTAVLSLLPGEQAAESGNGPARVSHTEEMRVTFDDVSYRYGESGSGVEGVSFDVSGPVKVGVIGPSGAGKSTLAGLIAGLLESTSGHISRPQVRFIPQNPYVFHATLADNIRFYNPKASIEDVRRAVNAVGLEQLVCELPDGLDTVVGEGARGLSGGQAHRVALARMLLDDSARVIVFDEPTAHLDIETELELKGPMLSLMEGRLVFMATHRLHWLDDMDRVITLEGGRVVSDVVKSEVRS